MKSENVLSTDNAWLKRLEDFEQSCLRYKSVRFSRFATPHDLVVFRARYTLSADVSVLVYGGADDCERAQIGFFPDFLEPDVSLFPITPILVTDVTGFTHRDILGSVLGLGVKREMVGDIFVDGANAVIMCDSQIQDFLLFNLKTVGRKKVSVSLYDGREGVSLAHAFETLRCVVASLRLDACVSAMTNLSRNDATDYILGEKVSVNFCQATSPSKKLCEGDVISVRHYGRFRLGSVLGETRKGRLSVEFKKYI